MVVVPFIFQLLAQHFILLFYPTNPHEHWQSNLEYWCQHTNHAVADEYESGQQAIMLRCMFPNEEVDSALHQEETCVT
jgi:hypothetical protein